MANTSVKRGNNLRVHVCGDWENKREDCGDVIITPALIDVAQERGRQETKWGGFAHDDRHRLSDWNVFVAEHNQKGVEALNDATPTDWRRRMIEVAALAFAAVESFDRKFTASADFVEANPAVLDVVEAEQRIRDRGVGN